MSFGVALVVVGGFLLGGAWSIWRAEHDTKGRTGPQVAFARLVTDLHGQGAVDLPGLRVERQRSLLIFSAHPREH